MMRSNSEAPRRVTRGAVFLGRIARDAARREIASVTGDGAEVTMARLATDFAAEPGRWPVLGFFGEASTQHWIGRGNDRAPAEQLISPRGAPESAHCFLFRRRGRRSYGPKDRIREDPLVASVLPD